MNRATTITPDLLPAFLVGLSSSSALLDIDIASLRADRALFSAYHSRWNAETGFSSSMGVIMGNANFRGIVSMGIRAVPFILEELESGPSLLVWALCEIYGCSISSKPVSISEASRLWLKALRG